ncbi:MAG: hypothetical protein VX185_00865, partial [Pseudomonadota bacterium]|nr:hypothetical protein [Pseudomonadota bacterium]
MATPAPTGDGTAFGGSGTLGSNFKLMPPTPQEVTTENWPDWSWKIKKYLSLEDPYLNKMLTELESQKTPVTKDQIITFNDEGTTAADVDSALATKRLMLAAKLEYFISNVVLGQTISLLKSHEDNSADFVNGFESWRLIAYNCRIEKNANLSTLMTQIVNYRFTGHNFEKDLENFEVLKNRYETANGKKLEDSFLIGLMYSKTEQALPALNTHLKLNAKDFKTYNEVRQLIIQYLRVGGTKNNLPGTVNALDNQPWTDQQDYWPDNYGTEFQNNFDLNAFK